MFQLDSIFSGAMERVEAGLVDLFDKLIELSADTKQHVESLRAADRQRPIGDLARDLVARSSRLTAVVGATTAAPDLLPIGWPTIAATVCVDFLATLKIELNLLLSLSFLYRPEDIEAEERRSEILWLLQSCRSPSSDDTSRPPADQGLDAVATKQFARTGFVALGKGLARQFLRRKLVVLVPFAGVVLSGGVNYRNTDSLGSFARGYYESRRRGK